MLDVVFRPKVLAQIDEISDLTIAEWGEPQAKAYVAEIRRQIERAAEFPGIGSSAYGLPADYRKVRAGSHRIIYRTTPTALIVIRIIHEREDVPDDLDG
jgi:toxin ParE1/3/4